MSEPFHIKRRGLMLVLSSPSGAGKSSIARRIIDNDPNIALSVSVTTRAKRPGEVDGVDYHYIDKVEFDLMRNRGELLESAKVFNNYYGTPRKPVEQALEDGKDVLFDIDWQGTQQLEETAQHDLVTVFILPPSTTDLERRLKARAQDPPEVVAKRMDKAADEMSHYPEYSYIIVNRDLEESVRLVSAILTAERLKRDRQSGLSDFVKGLREGY